MTAPIRAAVAWFTPATYARHRALDPEGLQPTFDDWLKDAEALRQQFERDGLVVVPVELDPDALAAWCRARHRDIDAKARRDLAIEILVQRSAH